jgi:hypothetical protein
MLLIMWILNIAHKLLCYLLYIGVALGLTFAILIVISRETFVLKVQDTIVQSGIVSPEQVENLTVLARDTVQRMSLYFK